LTAASMMAHRWIPLKWPGRERRVSCAVGLLMSRPNLTRAMTGYSREGKTGGDSVQFNSLKEMWDQETRNCLRGGLQVAENGRNERAVSTWIATARTATYCNGR
jgi:hypothetical protein